MEFVYCDLIVSLGSFHTENLSHFPIGKLTVTDTLYLHVFMVLEYPYYVLCVVKKRVCSSCLYCDLRGEMCL